MAGSRLLDLPTAVGPARVWLDPAAGPAAPLLVLGHGAGGGVQAPDLLAARAAAREGGWAVARVEQPYRVRGRRVAEGAARLDLAWRDVVTALRAQLVPRLLVCGGRSSGARVACRTAAEVAADAVLCLAFPLRPPGRGADRGGELTAPAVPRLVVQGGRDAFGIPAASPGVQVRVVAGADHAFAVRRVDGRSPQDVLGQVQDLVAAWLAALAA